MQEPDKVDCSQHQPLGRGLNFFLRSSPRDGKEALDRGMHMWSRQELSQLIYRQKRGNETWRLQKALAESVSMPAMPRVQYPNDELAYGALKYHFRGALGQDQQEIGPPSKRQRPEDPLPNTAKPELSTKSLFRAEDNIYALNPSFSNHSSFAWWPKKANVNVVGRKVAQHIKCEALTRIKRAQMEKAHILDPQQPRPDGSCLVSHLYAFSGPQASGKSILMYTLFQDLRWSVKTAGLASQVRIVPLFDYNRLPSSALGGRERYLKKTLLTAYLEDGDKAAQMEIFMCTTYRELVQWIRDRQRDLREVMVFLFDGLRYKQGRDELKDGSVEMLAYELSMHGPTIAAFSNSPQPSAAKPAPAFRIERMRMDFSQAAFNTLLVNFGLEGLGPDAQGWILFTTGRHPLLAHDVLWRLSQQWHGKHASSVKAKDGGSPALPPSPARPASAAFAGAQPDRLQVSVDRLSAAR
ncbi:hypothetical protein WJX74_005976 [Apatococcus lobatus]|uniref:Uncharacterized protein n=1 Tax=Apatococcus lobatus TaxID=904363 RepID=A0AAW1S5D3_9CHLO